MSGTPFDDVQWAAVLRSASAFEMYRKRHGRIAPKSIVEFLLLDPEFPRAIRFCLNSAARFAACHFRHAHWHVSQARGKIAGTALFGPGLCEC